MVRDPYVNNKIVFQLIQTPQASQRALDAAAHGRPVHNRPQTNDALVAARGWLHAPLKDEFRPPENVPLLAFAKEGAVCDVIRAAYSAGGLDIEIAQARYIVSLRIKGLRGQPGVAEVARAEATAKRILRMDDRIHFEELGTAGGRTWGKQSAAPGQRVDPDWPHWHDAIHWWTTADDVGFVTVKALGGPTREVIAVLPEMNTVWFAP